MNAEQELETLNPSTHTQEVNGVLITFNKVVVSNINGFSQAVNPILKDIKVADLVNLAVVNGNLELMQAAAIIQDIVAEHSQNIIKAISLTTDVDLNWLANQDVDVLIEIAHKVVEVNSKYFLPKVMPVFLAAISNHPQDGQQITQGLSNTATPSVI